MFQLATNTLIITPIEVNCTGSEQTIEGCQVVRPFQQCATGIAGINCTGMYTKLCACVGMYYICVYVCTHVSSTFCTNQPGNVTCMHAYRLAMNRE